MRFLNRDHLQRLFSIAIRLGKIILIIATFFATLSALVHIGYRFKWKRLYELESTKKIEICFGGENESFYWGVGDNLVIAPFPHYSSFIPRWMIYETTIIHGIKINNDFMEWDLLEEVIENLDTQIMLDISCVSIDDGRLENLLSHKGKMFGLCLCGCNNITPASIDGIVNYSGLNVVLYPHNWILSDDDMKKINSSHTKFLQCENTDK